MKAIFYFIISSMFFYSCISNAAKTDRDSNNIVYKKTDTVSFNAEVLPILQKKCSPCHFAGGKMFLKMPFDNSVTIISHEAGVLKRFSDKQEITLIKQFIDQHNKEN
jgi:hypothetical protein